MPDIITQTDIQSILETYNALGQRILGYRRRIQAGALIEPGEFQAHDAEEQPIDMEPTQFLNAYGLDIAPVGQRSELYVSAADLQKQREAAAETKFTIPDWVEFEPLADFRLVAWDSDERTVEIGLTQHEYQTLKHHLAELRGYVPEVTNA